MNTIFLKSVYLNYRNIKPITFLLKRVTSGPTRSVNAKKNILESFIIRGFSIAVSLILVPLTIHYINPTRYGIWLTLSSVIGWFSFFDIGFGNGLRNKLGESLAAGKKMEARIYVSTTYAILGIIISIFILLFVFINPFLNWAVILNTPAEMAQELSVLTLIVFVFFCIRFLLQLILIVLTADQKPSKAYFLNFIISLFALLIIFVLTKTTRGSLLFLGTAMSTTPVIVLTVSSILLYRKKYRDFAPSLKYVNFKYAKGLMSLGLKFFIINIACLVVYETSNIIITQINGPGGVTVYNIAYKYFGILTMGFSMILAPFWNAFTEAKVMNDYDWMKRITKKLITAWFIILFAGIIMLAFSSYLYQLWFGKTVIIPFKISAIVFLYVLIFNWCAIFSQISAGLGKIKIQFYIAIVSSFINIPLSIYLGNHLGIAGVVLAPTILGCSSAVWNPIQIYFILNKKAKGLWNE